MSKAFQKRDESANVKKVACAFCSGSGKDPFGQLYPGSTCQVCNGRKTIPILVPYESCAYCHGRGVEFSTQNTCTACLGKGVISISKREAKGASCKFCGGTGMEMETNLPCAHCHGLGRQ